MGPYARLGPHLLNEGPGSVFYGAGDHFGPLTAVLPDHLPQDLGDDPLNVVQRRVYGEARESSMGGSVQSVQELPFVEPQATCGDPYFPLENCLRGAINLRPENFHAETRKIRIYL